MGAAAQVLCNKGDVGYASDEKEKLYGIGKPVASGEKLDVEDDPFCKGLKDQLSAYVGGVKGDASVLYPVSDTGHVIGHGVVVVGRICYGEEEGDGCQQEDGVEHPGGGDKMADDGHAVVNGR